MPINSPDHVDNRKKKELLYIILKAQIWETNKIKISYPPPPLVNILSEFKQLTEVDYDINMQALNEQVNSWSNDDPEDLKNYISQSSLSSHDKLVVLIYDFGPEDEFYPQTLVWIKGAISHLASHQATIIADFGETTFVGDVLTVQNI